MEHRLIFSSELEEKLKNVTGETKQAWKDIGASSYLELMECCIGKLNDSYPKLNIVSFSFHEDIQVYGQSNTYFGLIKNEDNVLLAYVFVIPPKYETRSGVLAQQVFPVLSGITPELRASKDIRINNRPIFIVNLNEANLTASVAVNIKSGTVLGFNYIDVYDRDIEEILLSNGINPTVRSLKDYERMVAKVNKSGVNEFFKVDALGKTITFLTIRLKDGIHVNNEPYWFALKAYAALYLAKNEGYSCDMNIMNQLSRGNKTLDAFRDFVEKTEM
ncbi:MAG: hypothetical protein HFI20_10785 [Lachnospiraceae bacterium]|nr:hypothetical protein [Lachnospiraceae bacterium]